MHAPKTLTVAFRTAFFLFGYLSTTEMAFATTYHVQKAGFIGEFKSQAEAFRALIETAIKNHEEQRLTTDPAKAEVILQPKIIETGDNYLLFLDTVQQDEVVSSRMIKIKSFDELDVATERLVDATLSGKTIRQTVEVGKVVASDSDHNERRIATRNAFYLGFGPGFSSGMRSKDTMLAFDIGIAREFEQDIVKAMVTTRSGQNGDRSHMSGIGLGVQHLLSNQDTAPFIGGDLSYGSVSGNYGPEAIDEVSKQREDNYGHSKSGFMLGASAGYMMFRTANVHLDAGLSVRTFIGKLDSGNPTTYAFTIGLYL